MDLDDLKKTWQQASPGKIKHTDIMELIHHKSYGPIAALKASFRKQMRVMILLPVFLLLVNIKNWETALTSVLFWSYAAFCLGVVVYSYFSYRVVRSMEGMDGMVKANLQQQISLLETRLQRNRIGVRIVLLYFIVLLEVLPFFQHYRMLDKWHALSPLIRFGSYLALLVFQYFASRRVCRIRFGEHLAYLKNLVAQMQE